MPGRVVLLGLLIALVGVSARGQENETRPDDPPGDGLSSMRLNFGFPF